MSHIPEREAVMEFDDEIKKVEAQLAQIERDKLAPKTRWIVVQPLPGTLEQVDRLVGQLKTLGDMRVYCMSGHDHIACCCDTDEIATDVMAVRQIEIEGHVSYIMPLQRI